MESPHLPNAVQNLHHLNHPRQEVLHHLRRVQPLPVKLPAKWTVFRTSATTELVTVHRRRANAVLSVPVNAKDIQIASLIGLANANAFKSAIESASVRLNVNGIETVFPMGTGMSTEIATDSGKRKEIAPSPLKNTIREGKSTQVDAVAVFHAHLRHSGRKPSHVPVVLKFNIVRIAQRQKRNESWRGRNAKMLIKKPKKSMRRVSRSVNPLLRLPRKRGRSRLRVRKIPTLPNPNRMNPALSLLRKRRRRRKIRKRRKTVQRNLLRILEILKRRRRRRKRVKKIRRRRRKNARRSPRKASQRNVMTLKNQRTRMVWPRPQLKQMH